MKAMNVRTDHRVYLGPDRPLAEVLETERDGEMVALRLRQVGADKRSKGLWVAMSAGAAVRVRWRKSGWEE